MSQSGDFIDIRFQDQPRYQKPIGIYWLQVISLRVFGQAAGLPSDTHAIWPYRIPSLLGALIAILLTLWIGTILFDPPTATIGALLLAGSVILGVEARMATTDAVLLATVLACQGSLAYCFIRHYRHSQPMIGPPMMGLTGCRYRFVYHRRRSEIIVSRRSKKD